MAGLTLAAALTRLSAETELDIVFSENLVHPDMAVAEEPGSVEPEGVLAEILAPHGLTTRAGPGGRLVVVRLPVEPGVIEGQVLEGSSRDPLSGVRLRLLGAGLEQVSDQAGRFRFDSVAAGPYEIEGSLAGFASHSVPDVRVAPGGTAEVVLELSLITLEEIVITPSFTTVSREEPVVALSLDPERVGNLPVAGSDLVRAAGLLPGASGSDFSARFSLRGGRPDEILVLLDGLELLEPYHLKDFESPLSIVAPETLERLDLLSGGFPAAYGDRMSGVLDLTTRTAEAERQAFVGASLIAAGAGGSGRFGTGRGHWLGSVRRSVLDGVQDALDRAEKPRFWDFFGRLGYQLSPDQSLSARWLGADDRLDLRELSARGEESTVTEYSSSYGWLDYDATIGDRLVLDATLFAGRVDRDREGLTIESPTAFHVVDRRALDIVGVQHEGHWSPSANGVLHWGLSARDLESGYDYSNHTSLGVEGSDDTEAIDFDDRFTGRQLGAFVTHKQRFSDTLTAELGLRFDESEIRDEGHLSPRLNLAWAVSRRGVLRTAWGHFYQSQRAYELQVEDGETDFLPSERSIQIVAGYEHSFDNGLRLRADLQSRTISSPRVRYENLIDPVSRFPEIEADRVRIAPERARSESLELLVRRKQPRLSWLASYVLSSTEDRVEGSWIDRRVDQTHAVHLNFDYRFGSAWSLGLSGRHHTGWPFTPFAIEAAASQSAPTPTFGALYSDRLAGYASLDLRLARSWTWGSRSMRLYGDLLNSTNRFNPRGFEIVPDEDDPSGVRIGQKQWLPRVAIVGASFRF